MPPRLAAADPRGPARWRAGLVVLALQTSLGCAAVRPTLQVEAQDGAPRGRRPLAPRALALPDPGPHVVVLAEAVGPWDPKAFEAIGRVDVLVPSHHSTALRALFWANDLENRTLHGFCVWQAPFKLATLALWNVLPWAWPCLASSPSETAAIRAQLDAYARRAAALLGADAAAPVAALPLPPASGAAEEAHGEDGEATAGPAAADAPPTGQPDGVEAPVGARYVLLKRRAAP